MPNVAQQLSLDLAERGDTSSGLHLFSVTGALMLYSSVSQTLSIIGTTKGVSVHESRA